MPCPMLLQPCPCPAPGSPVPALSRPFFAEGAISALPCPSRPCWGPCWRCGNPDHAPHQPSEHVVRCPWPDVL